MIRKKSKSGYCKSELDFRFWKEMTIKYFQFGYFNLVSFIILNDIKVKNVYEIL